MKVLLLVQKEQRAILDVFMKASPRIVSARCVG